MREIYKCIRIIRYITVTQYYNNNNINIIQFDDKIKYDQRVECRGISGLCFYSYMHNETYTVLLFIRILLALGRVKVVQTISMPLAVNKHVWPGCMLLRA